MLDNRTKILEAAARVYAEVGFRGATTRRIADEAGVNEVTVFRHFGTKSALLDCVIQEYTAADQVAPLPAQPVNPQEELTTWVSAHLAHTRALRKLILQAMSELTERPDMGPCVGGGPTDAAAHLRDYVVRLRRDGWLDRSDTYGVKPLELNAAVAMLMNAYFGDAMSREMMPDMFPSPASEAPAAYVRVFLRAIGFRHSDSDRSHSTDPNAGDAPDVKPDAELALAAADVRTDHAKIPATNSTRESA